MQRRHRPASHAVTGIEVMPAAAKFEDSACLTQKRFRRSAAKKKDAVRVRQLNVAAQPWHQDIHLLVRRDLVVHEEAEERPPRAVVQS